MSTKLKITITAAVTALALVGIVFFAYLPLMDRIEQSSASFIEAKQRLAKAEQAAEELSRLERELDPYPMLSANLETTLLAQNQLVSLLALMEHLGKELRLIYDIQLVSSPDKDKMTFQIALTGDYVNAARFIRGLENMPFLNEIQRWQIFRRSPINAPLQSFSTSTSVSVGLTVDVFTK